MDEGIECERIVFEVGILGVGVWGVCVCVRGRVYVVELRAVFILSRLLEI